MDEERMTLRVIVTQPELAIDGAVETEISQEALIAFGRWYKGDKGDKGDSWENDFDIASNEDIDALFD